MCFVDRSIDRIRREQLLFCSIIFLLSFTNHPFVFSFFSFLVDRKIQPPDPITLYRPRLTFIQGQREHKLLVIGGYTYARNNFAGDDTIYWACRTSYKQVRCSSRVVTTLLDDGMYRITITNPKHNHPRRVNLSKEYLININKTRHSYQEPRPTFIIDDGASNSKMAN